MYPISIKIKIKIKINFKIKLKIKLKLKLILKLINNVDMKRAMAYQHGMSLVVIPCWWDGAIGQ